MARLALLATSTALFVSSCADDGSALEAVQEDLANTQNALREAQSELGDAREEIERLEEPQDLSRVLGSAAERAATVVDIRGADGDEIGEAAIIDGPHGMVIRVYASGLSEGWHAMHLHKDGDCSDPGDRFQDAEGHINPPDQEHGFLNPAGYHLGADTPNIYSFGDVLAAEVFTPGLSFGQANDEDGFALIIHRDEDDHMSQPIGGADARVGCASVS